MKRVDVFHVGPQKAARTWAYQCLREHPEIGCPPRDSIHYFDMLYHRGRDWYVSHFDGVSPTLIWVDPTYSYLRSPLVPARIAEENPEAKIIVCLRHPVERAFSHYWHEKRKDRFNYTFGEVLENYDLYASWIEPGFYATHLERFLSRFRRDQLLCQLYDDLERDPQRFYRDMLAFIGVEDVGFEPRRLHERINPARPWRSYGRERVGRAADRILRTTGLAAPVRAVKRALAGRGERGADRAVERLDDQAQALIAELHELFAPEIERLERLLGLDLAHWRRWPRGPSSDSAGATVVRAG